jgi:hypothetical protein
VYNVTLSKSSSSTKSSPSTIDSTSQEHPIINPGHLAVTRSNKKTTNTSNKKVGMPTDYSSGDTDFMKYYCFNEIKKYFPFTFYDWTKEGDDPWHPIGLLADGFNDNHSRTVAASFMKVLDEFMSSFVPQTTALGGLPNLSFVFRKPKPLGTEGKVTGCSETGE